MKLGSGRLNSNLEQGVDFGGTNKIILGKATDCVRSVFNTTFVVADHHVRVMILAMRDPRDRIYESNGLVVILEMVVFTNHLLEKLPSFELLHQHGYFRGRKRWHIAFAWFALLCCEIIGDDIH
jgi:hypothetical protein